MSYALTPNTVELIPTLGALSPRGGPVHDPVLTLSTGECCVEVVHLSKEPSAAKGLAPAIPHANVCV